MSKAGDGTFLVGKPPVPCQCAYCKSVREKAAQQPPTQPPQEGSTK